MATVGGAGPTTAYDVVVVGGRCAGSPTAMLLARAGLHVLVIDRSTFPSDTISGHMIKPPGVAHLERWGLLDELLGTGCPPIRGRHVQFGERVLELPPPPPGVPSPLAPRRYVLDALLLDAARAAGADTWAGALVRELVWSRGRVCGVSVRHADGRAHEVRARLVIGADGRNSLLARTAGSEMYGHAPTVSVAYYAYWRGFPTEKVEIYFEPGQMVGIFPTHEEQTLIFVQCPVSERSTFKADIVANYHSALAAVAPVAPRLSQASRTSRILGMAELPNFFRVPFGPGWALVGDAGHHKDPLVARGISDAWRDSHLLARAVIAGWDDEDAMQAGLLAYQHERDRASTDVARLNTRLARLELPMEELAHGWSELSEAERTADSALAL
jgi:2-polyprenyl-6-methoxyphenol hydroxylase-like FAD-dependent oxidoreductase